MKDDNSIFRAEAIQHKQEGWLGTAHLKIPSSLSIMLFAGVILFSFIISIISFGSYTQRVNVTGNVIYDPPAVTLIAQNEGLITYSSALEGTLVNAHEMLFSISNDTQTRMGSTSTDLLRLLKEQRSALCNKITLAVKESMAKKIT